MIVVCNGHVTEVVIKIDAAYSYTSAMYPGTTTALSYSRDCPHSRTHRQGDASTSAPVRTLQRRQAMIEVKCKGQY